MTTNRRYEWKDGMPPPPVEADIFGGVVEQIEAEKGKVEPGDVVEAARDPNSPIHSAFNWNDADAAEKYRVQQARRLIGGLTVIRVQIDEGAGSQAREFFSVRESPSHALAYQSRDKIASSDDLVLQVIRRARADFEAAARKYATIAAIRAPLSKVQEAVDEIRDIADSLETAARARAGRRAASVEEGRQTAAGVPG